MDGMYASDEDPDGGKFRIGAVISDASYRWCDSQFGNDLVTKLFAGQHSGDPHLEGAAR